MGIREDAIDNFRNHIEMERRYVKVTKKIREGKHITLLHLFDNEIARITRDSENAIIEELHICDGGYCEGLSKTTIRYLNSLPGVHIHYSAVSKDYLLNDVEWFAQSEWTRIPDEHRTLRTY